MPGALVTVATFSTAAEAETVRGLLEAEGIRTRLADSHMSTAEPLRGTGGMVGIQVEESSAARALEFIRAHEEEVRAVQDGAREDGEDAWEDRCVACGAAFPEYLEKCPACGLSYG